MVLTFALALCVTLTASVSRLDSAGVRSFVRCYLISNNEDSKKTATWCDHGAVPTVNVCRDYHCSPVRVPPRTRRIVVATAKVMAKRYRRSLPIWRSTIICLFDNNKPDVSPISSRCYRNLRDLGDPQ